MLVFILGTLAALAPLAVLLRWRAVFNNDWLNHLWMVGYLGEYLRRHHFLPACVNTDELVGMGAPIFYGYFFYPLLGSISAFTGPSIAVRLSAAAVLGLLFFLVYRAAGLLSGQRFVSFTMAALAVWMIYPLTSFYHRGALPEFFATELLLCALCSGLLFLRATAAPAQAGYALTTGLLLALTFGMHPITAVLGALAILVAGGVGRAFLDVQIEPVGKKALAVAVGLGALALSPWIYAVLFFLTRLNVPGNLQYWERFDGLLVRLWLLPYDPGFVKSGLAVETPFLDAQASTPLIIGVFLFLIFLRRARVPLCRHEKRALGVSLGALALALFLSVLPTGPLLARALGIKKVVGVAQFAYRLTTYINFFALLSIFLVLAKLPRSKYRGPVAISAALLFLGASALVIKLERAYRLAHEESFAGINDDRRNELAHLPRTVYSAEDYAITRGRRSLEKLTDRPLGIIHFPVLSGLDFGTVATVERTTSVGWYLTNIAAFPWSQVFVDDNPLEERNLAIGHAQRRWETRNPDGTYQSSFQTANLTALRLPAGTHRLAVRFSPSPVWRVLRFTSVVVMLIWPWAIAFCFFGVWAQECGHLPRPVQLARRKSLF